MHRVQHKIPNSYSLGCTVFHMASYDLLMTNTQEGTSGGSGIPAGIASLAYIPKTPCQQDIQVWNLNKC